MTEHSKQIVKIICYSLVAIFTIILAGLLETGRIEQLGL